MKRFQIEFEVIRDSEGIIDGYRLGKYYLMKHYYWMNSYEWIINTTGNTYYFDREFRKLVDEGEIQLTSSYESGLKRLIALNAE